MVGLRNILKFKKGFKNWSTTFDVKINCEYTPDLEKSITTIEFHLPRKSDAVTISWHVLEPFLMGTTTPYTDGRGLDISVEGKTIHIDGKGFVIRIHEDQAKSILIVCNRLRDDVNPSVQNLKNEV